MRHPPPESSRRSRTGIVAAISFGKKASERRAATPEWALVRALELAGPGKGKIKGSTKDDVDHIVMAETARRGAKAMWMASGKI